MWSAELDATLARVFGVEIDTAAWLPAEDSEPEALLRAAEQIGQAIGERRATAPPVVELPWTALPARPDVPPSPDERRGAIERVLTWAEAGGASWDGIEVHVDTDGNASVRARRTLSPGEAILTLPRRLMIVDNELARSTTGKLGLDDSRPRDALAAWLPLEMREPTSRWRAYLDALPVQLPELPMFHAADDLAALAGTAVYTNAAEDNRDVFDTYARLPLELRVRLSLAEFAWGCAIVKSRGFHAPGTLEHRIALFPIVDFFNHRIGDTTWTYDPHDGNFVITTERAFAVGDEVHLTYGDRSNARLFLHYGFTESSNIAGEADLLFDRASDPVNDVAAHLLWKLPLEAPARMRIACSLDHRFLAVLSHARLQAATSTERARGVEGGLAAYGDMPWLGGELEARAFDLMAAAARRALACFGAYSPPRTAWDRTCANLRDAEREVLEQIIELTATARPYLHWQDPAQVRAVAAAIPADAIGARGMLREYLRALASALTVSG